MITLFIFGVILPYVVFKLLNTKRPKFAERLSIAIIGLVAFAIFFVEPFVVLTSTKDISLPNEYLNNKYELIGNSVYQNKNGVSTAFYSEPTIHYSNKATNAKVKLKATTHAQSFSLFVPFKGTNYKTNVNVDYVELPSKTEDKNIKLEVK